MAEKPLRADAARNRARVLQVAFETFAAEGLGVPIDEIARRAGVGAGTVYRHFPTKESLFQAIVRDRMSQLAEGARALVAADPGDAVYRFMHFMVDEGAADQGLAEAFSGTGIDIGDDERDFMEVLGDLVARAQRAGTLRSDVDVMNIKTLIVGLQAMQRYRKDPVDLERVFRVVRDGLAAT
jgi:AcrR family transcriptional regulator